MLNKPQPLEARTERTERPPKPAGEPPEHHPAKEPPEAPKSPEHPENPEKETVSMTEQQFMLLVSELRKPVLNPQLEARKKRTREHNRALMRDQSKMLQARFLG